MNGDEGIRKSIERLVDEEHDLWEKEAAGLGSEQDRRRLEELEVQLDQLWDLLRQRRALTQAGRDPDGARLRDPVTVERYEQ